MPASYPWTDTGPEWREGWNLSADLMVLCSLFLLSGCRSKPDHNGCGYGRHEAGWTSLCLSHMQPYGGWPVYMLWVFGSPAQWRMVERLGCIMMGLLVCSCSSLEARAPTSMERTIVVYCMCIGKYCKDTVIYIHLWCTGDAVVQWPCVTL